MAKTILLTGATDGIGLATAKMLVEAGHNVLLHGRSADKLAAVKQQLEGMGGSGTLDTFRADLSSLAEVETLAEEVRAKYNHLDALINNAGVFRVSSIPTAEGLDVRFAVNVYAPYLLTRRLLPLLAGGRVVNLSSAAQAPVDLKALQGSNEELDDGMAYAESKLAITMWSFAMAHTQGAAGPVVVAVNPASMLGSKMVKKAYGVDGADLRIGADILFRAALSDEFADASGRYYDNDSRRFAPPHPDAMNQAKNAGLVKVLDAVLAAKGHTL